MLLSRLSLRAVALVTFASLVGCADAEPATNAGQTADDQTSARATLHFDADFEERLEGELRQGGTLTVDYDAARLPGCRDGANDGSAGWTITGFAKSAGQTETFYVAGHASDSRIDENDPPQAKLELAHAGDLELWFQITSLSGCNGYDSNEGANYRYSVRASDDAPATITFGAEGGPRTSGTLSKGSKVRLSYDTSRLKQCSAQAGVFAAYELGGDAKKYVDIKSGDAEIPLTKSGTLALWFETNDQYGCHDTDSNGGANYQFDVVE